MVTLGSMHPAPFQQALHAGAGAGPCDGALNFESFELALNDIDAGDMADPSSSQSADPAEERASPAEPSKPARRRSSILMSALPAQEAASSAEAEGVEREGEASPSPAPSSGGPSVYRQSSAHRLFRPAPPEPKKQRWGASHDKGEEANSNAGGGGGGGGGGAPAAAPMSGGDSRLRASSWHSSDSRQSPPPPPPGLEGYGNNGDRFFPKRRGRDDREVRCGTGSCGRALFPAHRQKAAMNNSERTRRPYEMSA